MSGVPVPVYPITEPFGADGTVGDDVTLPIPVAASATPGAASFETGFPPVTRTTVAPFGQDVNGILYMLSAYAALEQAGQICPYSAAVSTALGGYAVGAELASITTPGRVWTNFVNGNTNDPDAVSTGWAASDPLYITSAPATGTFNDVALPGPSDFAWDVDTSAGPVTFTGFVAQRNGQRLYLTATAANLLNLSALTGSAANNQIRAIAGGTTGLQNLTLVLEYISVLNKWLVL